MNARLGYRWISSLLALTLLASIAACQETSTPTFGPTPTAAVRHRDAFSFLLTAQDLNGDYVTTEIYRLARGKGWTDETTRLSGYYATYTSKQGRFSQITCQVECYLSLKDAQTAYRAYKQEVGDQVHSDEENQVDESEERALGEWSWVFDVRTDDQETLHYVFLRENVLVEMILTGPRSPEFKDQAIRYAQLVDQRIAAR